MVATFRLVHHCPRVGNTSSEPLCFPRRLVYTHPFRRCPSRSTSLQHGSSIGAHSETQDVHAIPATAHGLSVSRTLCSNVATRASCTTHRIAAVTNELPTRNPKKNETAASKRIKEKASPTLNHVNFPEAGTGLSIMTLIKPFSHMHDSESTYSLLRKLIYRFFGNIIANGENLF